MRVYYEDTDAGGVVYHAQYLNFMERARTEWLRHLGFDQTRLADEQGIIFVAYAVQVKFAKPARLNDMLQVTASIESARHFSLVFAQKILRADEILTRASVSIACLNTLTLKPVALPANLRKLLI
ncbi:MAG: tol-pal system-associated acyl-CoA thioesterase [Burkholderiales bacterium]